MEIYRIVPGGTGMQVIVNQEALKRAKEIQQPKEKTQPIVAPVVINEEVAAMQRKLDATASASAEVLAAATAVYPRPTSAENGNVPDNAPFRRR